MITKAINAEWLLPVVLPERYACRGTFQWGLVLHDLVVPWNECDRREKVAKAL